MKESNYMYITEEIRYKSILADDYNEGAYPSKYKTSFFSFEVLKRPYFFGLIGRKRWCSVGDWATIQFGHQYSRKVLGRN